MKRKKLILLCLSIVLLCVFFCFGVVTAGANEAVLSSVSYQETYNLGDRLDVQSAKFTYKSNEYEAKAVINYPSGKRISSNSVLLTEGGVHTIEYLTTIDGKVCSETYQFTVLDSVYTIDGSGEMEYGSNSYFDGLGDVKGLNVSLGKDSTFKFNSVIDVSNLDRYDTVMKWYSTPKVLGSYDVARVYFRLTDVYNPDNYVEMLFKYSPDNNYASTYIVGYANGQLPSGLHYRSKGASATSYEFNGYHYTLYQNNRHYGYLAELSFSGEVPPYNKDFSENCMRFAIDYQERQLYCTPAWGNNMDKCIVIDLDDSRIFGDNVWGGFTTGEVLASVYAEQYSTSSYNFFVSEIYGHEVGDLFASNSVAPNIVVDTLGYNENDLPDAVVNREYKILTYK